MSSAGDNAIRKELQALLEGGNAHAKFDDIFRNFPEDLRGKRPRDLPYSGWDLLEHIRIAQYDILEFIRNPEYESPPWPEGYWPKSHAPADASAWNKSIRAFRADRQTIIDLVNDPKRDLVKPFPHGTGQTLFREALLVADHTAYHLGQIVEVRRLLGAWKHQ